MVDEILGRYKLEEFVCKAGEGHRVLLFFATNHPLSATMEDVVNRLASIYGDKIEFGKVNVKRLPSTIEGCNITKLPYVWFVTKGNIVDEVSGVDQIAVAERLESISAGSVSTACEPKPIASILESMDNIIKERVEKLFLNYPITILGGDCEQTRAFIAKYMDGLGLVHYTLVDEDLEVQEYIDRRDNIKCLIDPCVYLNGKLWKYCKDLVLEVKDEADLKATDEKAEVVFNEYLKSLTTQSEVMVFIKGKKSQPFCKFSKKMVSILNSNCIDFDYFDIFTDLRVIAGMKKYSNWPTFPQLYVRGKFVGGSDVVEQISLSCGGDSGEFKKALFN